MDKLNADEIASSLHDFTFGITSDPLTQFAILFSALIHDCDHYGISNGQIIKEGHPISEKYKNKSVAEQNSVGTLMVAHACSILHMLRCSSNTLPLFLFDYHRFGLGSSHGVSGSPSVKQLHVSKFLLTILVVTQPRRIP